MLHFRANGQDAMAAVQALITLVERDFELAS
jgi:phosphotransferase system HPr-like phosphotransfer protein